MRILYIGNFNKGSTSRMRGLALRDLLATVKFTIADTSVSFANTPQPWRSMGFRWKSGPLITTINKQVVQCCTGNYDLIWIDKGVFLTNQTVSKLRNRTSRLIHFTPDTAFYGNRSRHFEQSAQLYDLLVTTKSFELSHYQKLTDQSKILLTTQGFEPKVHFPRHSFQQKECPVGFAGLAEPHRKKVIEELVQNEIPVRLAGRGWRSFARRHRNNPYLNFHGEVLHDHEYSRFISGVQLALGFLSRKFPELHTTRTLEIPACGTALLTESTPETREFFNDNEAIFYNHTNQLICKIKHFLNYPQKLETITANGNQKVMNGGFDYHALLSRILKTLDMC